MTGEKDAVASFSPVILAQLQLQACMVSQRDSSHHPDELVESLPELSGDVVVTGEGCKVTRTAHEEERLYQ
jgi:hypothetical protein